MTPALGWLEERLVRQGTNADELVRQEHQLQGATNVTVRNIITSMRLISDVDWTKFFETVSLVDEVLRAGGTFGEMDFATRDLYRTAIEQMARGTGLAEIEIARRALAVAATAPESADGDRRNRDPGHYLLGSGRAAFEQSIGFRTAGLALRRRFARSGIAGYVGSVAADGQHRPRPALLGLAGLGVGGWSLGIMAFVGLLPAIDAAADAGQPRGHRRLRRDAAAGNGPARRRAGRIAHHGRDPDPADDQRRDRRADRAARGSLSFQSGRRDLLRAAVRLDRCADRVDGGRCRLLAAVTDGIAQLNARYPNGSRRRSLPPAPSPPRLERGAAKVDRLGAQARQAA